MVDTYLIINAVIIIAFTMLSVAALIQNSKAKLNRIFAVFVSCTSIWLAANYISNDISHSQQTATIANYFVFSFSFFAVWSLLHFAAELTDSETIRERLHKLVVPAICAGVVFASPLTISGVEPQGNLYAVEFGPAIVMYAILLVGSFLTLFVILARQKKNASSSQLARIHSFYLSALFSIPLVLMFQFIIPAATGWFGMTNIGISPMLILAFGMYYGAIRHQLLNLRLIVVRSLAYGLSVIILSIFYSVSSYYVTTLLPKSSGRLVYSELINVLFIMVIVGLFGPILAFFKKQTDNLFYRDAYDTQYVLNTINITLVNTVKLDDIVKKVATTIEKELKITRVEFLLGSNVGVQRLSRVRNNSGSLAQTGDISASLKFMKDSSAKIVVYSDETVSKSVLEEMRNAGIDCMIRMTANGERVGLMLVAPRKSGNAFNAADLQLLEIVADEIAIAIQNALHFEEIQQFNITLQERVEQATKELRKTNDKLKKLDETKDEFISMASHQLRTPLTSVKGYLSMVLEGDAGELNDLQRQLLGQSYSSSQRMVYLISDLLNLSRLNTGKFVIEPAEVDLREVVAAEIDQLRETAKSRGVSIVYNAPQSFPLLMLDETKTHQVVMNFLDNAIYYTPTGGEVHVSLVETATAVEYRVKDSGIGVPRSEQHRLFSKFYRAENARRVRPDGTGLGLFMSKKVVVAQGGSIIFESEEGKGSTFGFRFGKSHFTASKG